ncbi:DNA polymerase IV [Nakamurella sp. YIM 132087]|uniref:DNA polymerase IV n=1 Tax=Nakamurella alba TaxID=2665158 RepID=A0A7K1FLI2_9ACTN|nr:DNA polymerase IV [Nakamurella alba]MTD15007.1 DNA polymerase IV [Nakamurella alba]
MTAPDEARPWVLHVDMDQFIAAVEVQRRPELAGLPVVVGGNGDPTERAVVATASYEARAFGIHSGMPLKLAVRKCKDAVFLPSDHAAYDEVSAQVMAALAALPGVTVEILGWDEAFVGAVTADPEQLARDAQQAVLAATGLHCTVGIGDTTVRAKMATGFGKPQGIFRLTAATWLPVLGERPTEALWGIGKKTAAKLADLGLHTVAQLAAADPRMLAERLGPTMGPYYAGLGRGLGRTEVIGTPWVPRSRSREVTYQQDLTTWEQIRQETEVLARKVHEDIKDTGRPVGRMSVKVRFKPFFTQIKIAKLPAPTTDVEEMVAGALRVLEKFEDHDRPVRLLGVRAEFVPDQDESGRSR